MLSPSYQVPVQARSRRSFEKLLDAAEQVIADRGFESASVGEICRQAGLTSGAFYARFGHKSDLVEALIARFGEEAGPAMAALAAPSPSLRSSLERLVETLVDIYWRRQRLVQALTACAKADSAGRETMRHLNQGTLDQLTTLLCRHESELRADDPATAVRLALVAAFTTTMEVIVDRRMLPGDYPFTPKALAAHLTDMLHAYLGVHSHGETRDA